ncbi:hypothetical protein C2845_PM09G14810 [Panicum miliaceum]|uniref:DUF8040 domain-containing protein n=1 Tax=Panicum miliaceum TaxID=4540 RepID=A0A3L6RYW1_PANMI|nr:hypothetical protein C2845_PM09G14810 [Panicum miliaceum]
MDDSALVINRKIAFFSAFILAYWTLVIYRSNSSDPIRYSLLERNKERMKYLQKIYCGEEKHCIAELQMGKSVFFKLCHKLRTMGAHRDTWHCTVEEQIVMFLTTVGHHKKNSDISFHFTRCGETVSRYFNEVSYAVRQLGPEMLRHRSLDIPSKILGNPRFDPYFKTPYNYPSTQDADLISDKNPNHDDADPSLQYDSECIPEKEGNNGGSSSGKHPTAGKADKRKRVKHDDGVIKEVTHVLRDMTDTMRFTHVSRPHEELFKTIDGMDEYPLFVRLELQST